MALYGDTNFTAVPKCVGVGDGVYVFKAHFTTVNNANPTIDSAKTRGVVSIIRTGEGVWEVTLPFGLRNCGVLITPWAYPSGAIANGFRATHVEGSRLVQIRTFELATGNAEDAVGLELDVRIEGRN